MGYTVKDIEKLVNQSVSPWLIKSSGRVLGPFSKEDILEKLKTRELVPLDEVSKPMGRWKYLRDEPTFRHIVDSIKSNVNSDNEQTKTSNVDGQSALEEMTQTVDINDGQSEMTESVTHKIYDETQRSSSRSRKKRRESFDDDEVSSYGFSGDKNIESEIKQSSKLGWIITLVIMVLVGTYIYRMKSQDPEAPVGNISGNIEEGYRAYQSGEYKKAISFLRKALALDPKNADVILKLTPLLLQYENDFVYSRKILEDILNYQTERRYLLEANTIMALAFLLEGRAGSAKDHLEAGAVVDYNYQPLLANTAAYFYQFGDYDRVLEQYQKGRGQERMDGVLAMYAVQAHVKKFERNRTNMGEVQSALAIIDDYLRKHTDYRQEFLLARAFVSGVLLGVPDSVDVVGILEEDPFVTGEHWHNPQVYQNGISWTQLMGWCEQLYMTSKKTAHYEGLLGLCLLKAKKGLEGAKVLENAVEKDPNSSVLIALQAYQMILANDVSRGLGVLSRANEDGDSQLALSLLGRFCRHPSRAECARGYWKNVLVKDSLSIAGISGLAQVHLELGEHTAAERMLRKGLNEAPTYIPFIRAKFALGIE